MIVAYQNQVVMQETLEGALADLFGGVAVRSRESGVAGSGSRGCRQPRLPTPRLPTLIREAKQHYDAALEAQRNIDWAKYGEEMRKLGEVLERIGGR